MKRLPRVAPSASRRGRCVVCGAEGTSGQDHICGECGDPFDITLFCRSCGRRWSLPEDPARELLAEHGYRLEDLRGLVLKIDRCSRCLAEGQTTSLDVYRVQIPGASRSR